MYSKEYNDLEKHLVETVRKCIKEEVEKLLQVYVDDKSPLLTIQELSVKLKVTKATIHNYLKKGLINGEKMGKNRYFKMAEVNEALKKYGYNEAHAIGRLNDQIAVEEWNRKEIERGRFGISGM